MTFDEYVETTDFLSPGHPVLAWAVMVADGLQDELLDEDDEEDGDGDGDGPVVVLVCSRRGLVITTDDIDGPLWHCERDALSELTVEELLERYLEIKSTKEDEEEEEEEEAEFDPENN